MPSALVNPTEALVEDLSVVSRMNLRWVCWRVEQEVWAVGEKEFMGVVIVVVQQSMARDHSHFKWLLQRSLQSFQGTVLQ